MKSGRWGVLFSSEETNPVSAAAREVGGYGELIRLERERRAIVLKGLASHVVRDEDGRYSCRPQIDTLGSKPVLRRSALAQILDGIRTWARFRNPLSSRDSRET